MRTNSHCVPRATPSLMCLCTQQMKMGMLMIALSSAEEDAKAVQLVQAVAMQIRNFNKMTVACSQATISSMDASVLTIKKANMTQEDHAILAATNIINANASTFFNL